MNSKKKCKKFKKGGGLRRSGLIAIVAECSPVLIAAEIGHSPIKLIEWRGTFKRSVIDGFIEVEVVKVSLEQLIEKNSLIFIGNAHLNLTQKKLVSLI